MENDSLSKLTKLSKFTKYLIEIEDELWHSFKLVALSQGLKIKDAIREAIIEYIKNHQTQETKIEVQIIKNIEARQDLLQFIIEEDIKHKLKEIIRASQNLKRNFDWMKVGFDFKTFEDTEVLKLMFFACSEENKIKGNIYIRDIKIKELGPVPQYGPTPYISAIASTNEKRDRIYIIVINKNLNESMKTRIKINGFKYDSIVRAWVLNGPSVDATNEGCQELVKIHYREKKVDSKDGAFYFTFEPHSVTALELIKTEN